MKLFNIQENRIKCGKCGTEFDLNKNEACPLCSFGKVILNGGIREKTILNKHTNKSEMLTPPPNMPLGAGEPYVEDENEVWGSWLMVNDFFSMKFLTRVLGWKMKNEQKDNIPLLSLLGDAVELIEQYKLTQFKGFPNKITNKEDLQKDNAVSRLVYHFLYTGEGMGFFEVTSDKNAEEPWDEKWKDISVSLTKEGLEFAQLRNLIFDDGEKEQILTTEEREWLVKHLKKIDKENYKEYSILKEVYEFLKAGNNGNKDLWNWFENNKKFRDYILKRSEKARKDEKVFKKQIYNYARSFASAKISLLREMGIVRNKRNDYTIIGEL